MLPEYDYERTLGVLGRIAKAYPESSEEYQALELTTLAFIKLQDDGRVEAFRDFVTRFRDKLTPDELDKFREFIQSDETKA